MSSASSAAGEIDDVVVRTGHAPNLSTGCDATVVTGGFVVVGGAAVVVVGGGSS
jgi:hypothetical protein